MWWTPGLPSCKHAKVSCLALQLHFFPGLEKVQFHNRFLHSQLRYDSAVKNGWTSRQSATDRLAAVIFLCCMTLVTSYKATCIVSTKVNCYICIAELLYRFMGQTLLFPTIIATYSISKIWWNVLLSTTKLLFTVQKLQFLAILHYGTLIYKKEITVPGPNIINYHTIQTAVVSLAIL